MHVVRSTIEKRQRGVQRVPEEEEGEDDRSKGFLSNWDDGEKKLRFQSAVYRRHMHSRMLEIHAVMHDCMLEVHSDTMQNMRSG